MNKQQVYEIDENGYIKEIYVAYFDNKGNLIDNLPGSLVLLDPPHGLFKARWDDTKWVEGATQEEIDELTKVEPSLPTQTELLATELARTNQMVLELTEIILGGM